jgi:hypothetical protein
MSEPDIDPREKYKVNPEDLYEEFFGNRAAATKANGQTEWPEPESLLAPRETECPYPVEVLPPIIRDAVGEYQQYGQQPLPMIATSALATTSLVTQGLADVARDEYLRSPLSLYFLSVGISGERKTSSDGWYKAAPLAWMIARGTAMQAQVDSANAAMAAWKAEHDGLLAKIRTASGKANPGNGLSVEQLRAALIAVEQAKPSEVILPHLFYEDTNAATLAPDLAEGWPSASLWTDEAGLVVGSYGMADDHAMGFLGLLNRIWDGNPFNRDRASVRRARIRGRRFTVSLMAQPIVMERLLNLAGGASRGMGFIARFLISWPASRIGSRPYQAPVEEMPAIRQLRQRLTELLDMPLPRDPEVPSPMALAPPALQLTARAQRLWEWFHDDTEHELGETGEFADVADIGAKTAENAARLAGNFHVLEHGPVGEIDSKTLYRAVRIVSWHLYEARRVLAAFDKSQGLTDAEALLKWLRRQPARNPPAPINPRHILRSGPRQVRDAKRRDAAMKTLADHYHLLPHGSGKGYVLNPRSLT